VPDVRQVSDEVLTNGRFNCSSATPAGTIVYSSNSADYIVVEDASGKRIASFPAIFWRDGDCKVHGKHRCQDCAKQWRLRRNITKTPG
jgi:hypothetical protein